jgi:HSP20 family protein
MRRNEEYMSALRERDLSPMGTSGGYGSSGFSTSPWLMIRGIQEDVDRVASQFFGSSAGSGGLPATIGQQGTQTWAPSVDISQNDKEWCIEADLPGVKKEDVNVEVRAGYLVLGAEMRRGDQPQGQQEGYQGQQRQQGQQGQEGQQRQHTHRERRYGSFQRVLTLPDNLDEDKINCEFQNGVLTVHVPKMEQRAPQQRRILVGDGTEQGNGHSRRAEPAMAGVKGGGGSSAEHPQGQKQEKKS